MNVYRFIGALGFITGSIALLLVFISVSETSAWVPDMIAIHFQDQSTPNFLGGIGAIASGAYLVIVGHR